MFSLDMSFLKKKEEERARAIERRIDEVTKELKRLREKIRELENVASELSPSEYFKRLGYLHSLVSFYEDELQALRESQLYLTYRS